MLWKDLLAFYGGFRLLDDLTNSKGGGSKSGGGCGCLVLIVLFFLFYILFC